MVQPDSFNVEVCYANECEQVLLTVTAHSSQTIEDVIHASSILTQFPDIDLLKQKVGIWGRLKTIADHVESGDRIEIYRLLKIDPKEARRAKAKRLG